jgi:DNA-binding NarL/FixJ family response regulator
MKQLDRDSQQGPRVLVVDDSSHLRSCVRQALERAGLVVVGEAEDGEQALVKAAQERPDVVLMDLRMPKMDGIRATQALHVQQPETPVVLWSGEGEAGVGGAVAVSGASAGVCKGTRTSDLIATLRRICAAR